MKQDNFGWTWVSDQKLPTSRTIKSVGGPPNRPSRSEHRTLSSTSDFGKFNLNRDCTTRIEGPIGVEVGRDLHLEADPWCGLPVQVDGTGPLYFVVSSS
jgi:hypothetical protein